MIAAVLSPHPDDAVLSCWRVLTGRGDVTVVNVFTGAPNGSEESRSAWWDRLTSARSSARRMRDRLVEDAEALALAGRTATNLDFLDAQYRDGDQAVEAVAERLAAVLDRATLVYAPAALGAVVDHDIVTAAAVMLEGDGYEVAYYADIPHAIQFGWPTSITGGARDPGVDVNAYWQSKLERSLPRASTLVAEVHTLGEEAAGAKIEAIRTYRTQLAALIALNPRLADPATLQYEALWRRR